MTGGVGGCGLHRRGRPVGRQGRRPVARGGCVVGVDGLGVGAGGVGDVPALRTGPFGHALYALTGSFFNPGPYSGYLAMALPVCLHEYLCRQQTDPAGRYAAALAGLLILCVLPAGMSRSAWLAAGVSCGWVYGRHRGWGQRLRAFRQRKPGLFRGAVAGVCAVVCLGGLGLYQLKPDSALGRLFMARMSARAVWAEPWTGHGAGSFAAAYGEAQEAYFAAGRHAAWEERVAGSPEYAFNEYLQAAVEGGIPLTLLLLAGIGWGWRQGLRRGRWGCCGALLALGVFACSSYPLQLPVFVVTGACLLAACVCGGSRRGWLALALWQAASALDACPATVPACGPAGSG